MLFSSVNFQTALYAIAFQKPEYFTFDSFLCQPKSYAQQMMQTGLGRPAFHKIWAKQLATVFFNFCSAENLPFLSMGFFLKFWRRTRYRNRLLMIPHRVAVELLYCTMTFLKVPNNALSQHQLHPYYGRTRSQLESILLVA